MPVTNSISNSKLICPAEGNQPRPIEKTSIASKPSQKTGME